jgi:hypothetical protein
MTAVMAIFAGFPALTSCWYFALRSGLKRWRRGWHLESLPHVGAAAADEALTFPLAGLPRDGVGELDAGLAFGIRKAEMPKRRTAIGQFQTGEVGLDLLLVIENVLRLVEQTEAVEEEAAEPADEDVWLFVLEIGKLFEASGHLEQTLEHVELEVGKFVLTGLEEVEQVGDECTAASATDVGIGMASEPLGGRIHLIPEQHIEAVLEHHVDHQQLGRIRLSRGISRTAPTTQSVQALVWHLQIGRDDARTSGLHLTQPFWSGHLQFGLANGPFAFRNCKPAVGRAELGQEFTWLFTI